MIQRKGKIETVSGLISSEQLGFTHWAAVVISH